jgi:hypothetical protein
MLAIRASIVALAIVASATVVGDQARAGGSLYTLALSSSNVGGVITLDISVTDNGGGAYQAVQWNIDYDESVVSFVSAASTGPAPADCDLAAPSDNGDRLLVGCINFGGDLITFSGTAFTATFNCVEPSLADFDLTSVGVDTFVTKTSGGQPITVTNTSVDCDDEEEQTPQATQPATQVIATATPTRTPVPDETAVPGETPGTQPTTGPAPTTPGPGTTPGGGTGPGGVVPPSTGTGGSSDVAGGVWLTLAMSVLGGAVLAGGLYGLRRHRVRE